jgi:hypothetical protein
MRAFRLFIAGVILLAAGHAAAQSGERGSIPPGKSQDGAAPSDGAIQGGTILPGESGGIPDRAVKQARCDELLGSLREECLEKERAARGGTQEPGSEPPSDMRKRLPAPAD